jgi:hypothetical protein
LLLSINRTLTPFSASLLAAISPLGPAPTIITSLSTYSRNSSANSDTIAFVTSFSEIFENIAI